VLPVKPDGGLSDYTQLVKMEGTPGPHRVEQPGSHPHQIVFDPSGRFVLVPDKGLDRVFVFRFDEAAGQLTPGPEPSERTRSGAGPRHLAFHPKLAVVWVLNELGNTVTTYNWDGAKGSLTAVQTLPTLPENFTGDSTAAELAVTADGKFLYTSNRGHDSIAAFQVNPKTGLLKTVEWTSSGGKVPRYIAIEPGGKTLLAANEQGDTIFRFAMNAGTGALKSMGAPIANGTPVTVAFSV
jgi:6-phosphogluconolactonase